MSPTPDPVRDASVGALVLLDAVDRLDAGAIDAVLACHDTRALLVVMAGMIQEYRRVRQAALA